MKKYRLSCTLLITWWGTNDSLIGLPTKAIKFCSSGSINIMRWNNINHLNECIILGIKFGATTPQKSKVALIYAIINYVAAHCSLFPLQHVDLLPAKTRHCIQLHLLPTASVLNAATVTILSMHANNWNNIIWGMGQFLSSSCGHSKKMHGIKALAELNTSWKCVCKKI